MEKELREIIEAKIEILSEKKKKDGSLYVIAPWIMTGKRNRNGRLYSLPLIQREVARFQDQVKERSVIGSADHPGGAFTTLADASHIITKLEVDKNGQGWVEMKVLPTSKGKNVIEIIKAKGQLGLSARGAGTVSQSGIVQSDYRLLGIDIVTNPSEPTAVFNKQNVFESADFFEESKEGNMKNMMGLEESYVDEMMQLSYEIFVKDEGFKGTFSDFEKQMGNNILAEILVTEGKCKDTEEALKYLGVDKSFEEEIINRINDNKEEYLEGLEGDRRASDQKLTEGQISVRMHRYYTESVQGGFIGSYLEWQEKFPKLVEMASEGRIVEKEDKPGKPFKSRTTWNEVVASGFRGTIAEWKEKFPNIEVVKLEAPKKPVVEKTLREQAGVIFAELMRDDPKSSIVLEDIIKLLEKEEIAKADKRLRKKAIYIVNASIAGSGSVPTQEMLEKMVAMEIENLKEQRKEMREKNWQIYRKLLSE